MNDEIEITLPVSGEKVIIRNYTTVGDDEKSESALYAGVQLDQQTNKDSSGNIKFPLANIIASQKAYIPRLIKSIDDDSTNIELRLKELRSEDYAKLREEIDKITGAHSPKAKGAEKASKVTTKSS